MKNEITRHRNLDDLAKQITAEHNAATGAARSAVEHAHRCGQLLIQAKQQLRHGKFLPWLKNRVKLSPRQSQKYMP